MIYLDHAATTMMYPEAIRRMLPYMQKDFYNPSGSYKKGVYIHKELEKVRRQIAESIHANPEEITYTSGGTEADNWVLVNAARNFSDKGRHIITSQIEHHAILHTCHFLESQGFEITYLPVNSKGIVEPEELERAIRPDTILVSVMYANNEIGTIQPIAALGEIAGEHGIPFHSDAVQAYCHLPIDVEKEHLDFMSVSAHKFGGPKGVGFLYSRKGKILNPFLYGGAQEGGRRAGTENVAGIIGMGEAVSLSLMHQKEHAGREQYLRDYLMNRILSEIEMVRLNGSATERLPGNLNISFRGIEGQTLIAMLEMEGIYVSGGSACTSREKGPSHVLKALGLTDDMAGAAVRITIGYENTFEEINSTFHTIRESVEQLRKIG